MHYEMRSTRSSARCVARFATPGLLAFAAALAFGLTGVSAGDAKVNPVAAGDTQQAAAEIELGRRLFFDPSASPSGRRSCASCHDPDHGFSDPKRLSDDDFGITTRHSQTIIDGASNPSAHWDGEFETVEDLVRQRIRTAQSPWATPAAAPVLPEIELEARPFLPEREGSPLRDGSELSAKTGMQVRVTDALVAYLHSRAEAGASGSTTSDDVAATIEAQDHYREAFTAAYGSVEVSADRIARAIGAYCKTVKSTEAPIDRFLAGDERALKPAARRGLDLFRGRAGCVTCHPMTGERPAFTDYASRNTGLAWSGVRRHYGTQQIERLGMALQDPRVGQHRWLVDEPKRRQWLADRGGAVAVLADRGRGPRASDAALERAFKTPTLRDVAKRPPYMHDGSLKTLEAVVRYYAKGCCSEDPLQDGRLKGFTATDGDVGDLVAFLQALSGAERPGLARTVWPQRTRLNRVRVVGSYGGGPLGKTQVVLSDEGDVLPVVGTLPPTERHMTTDEAGFLDFAPGGRTHVRVRLLGDRDPQGGLLIPDSSRMAIARMPVKDKTTVTMTFPLGSTPPALLYFRHRDVSAAPVTTGLRRAGSVRDEAGRTTVTYHGWARTDVSGHVELDLPDLVDPLRGGKPVKLGVVLRANETLHLDFKTYAWRKP